MSLGYYWFVSYNLFITMYYSNNYNRTNNLTLRLTEDYTYIYYATPYWFKLNILRGKKNTLKEKFALRKDQGIDFFN